MNADQSIEESSKVAEIIEKAIYAVSKDNPPEKITYFFKTTFNNILRDCAHFLEFLILGVLAILYSDKFKITFFRRFCFTLIFCILVALIDEIIQIFSPGRAFELSDLILDGSGSTIGGMLILLLSKIGERR